MSSVAPGSAAIASASNYRTTHNLSNVSNVTSLAFGPNYSVINNSDSTGGIFTSLPIATPILNVGNSFYTDSNGNVSTNGTVTATSLVTKLADGTTNAFSLDTVGNLSHLGNLSVGTIQNGTSAFLVDSLAGSIISKGNASFNGDIRSSNGNLYSSTSYGTYTSSTDSNIVVNKQTLNQVVKNITGGSPDTIAALQTLVQSFNTEDVSILNTVLSNQNTVNNNLLSKIDILYTYFFNNVSDSISLDNLYGDPTLNPQVVLPNISIVNGHYVFTEPNPYSAPVATVSGSITVSGSGGPGTTNIVSVNADGTNGISTDGLPTTATITVPTV
jgi:hypothetical protein